MLRKLVWIVQKLRIMEGIPEEFRKPIRLKCISAPAERSRGNGLVYILEKSRQSIEWRMFHLNPINRMVRCLPSSLSLVSGIQFWILNSNFLVLMMSFRLCSFKKNCFTRMVHNMIWTSPCHVVFNKHRTQCPLTFQGQCRCWVIGRSTARCSLRKMGEELLVNFLIFYFLPRCGFLRQPSGCRYRADVVTQNHKTLSRTAPTSFW